MAYHKYITPALICGSKTYNTSDKSYLLFTREAGMLYATAKSVREERSKHRYAMQDFSLATVSLIKGKTGWRVTGSETITNFYFVTKTRGERAFIRNIVKMLRRFLHGEEPHQDLYDEIVEALKNIPKHNLSDYETIVMSRVFKILGYIAPEEETKALFSTPNARDALAASSKEKITMLKRAIKEAEAVSHL